MACNIAGFSINFGVGIFPYAQCRPPYDYAGCINPGSTVQLYVQVQNNTNPFTCSCATVAFYVNGAEIGRKELCVNPGYKWDMFGYLETTMTYVIPAYGTYDFCAEIISVR